MVDAGARDSTDGAMAPMMPVFRVIVLLFSALRAKDGCLMRTC